MIVNSGEIRINEPAATNIEQRPREIRKGKGCRQIKEIIPVQIHDDGKNYPFKG